jgi:hypothetical protein
MRQGATTIRSARTLLYWQLLARTPSTRGIIIQYVGRAHSHLRTHVGRTVHC